MHKIYVVLIIFLTQLAFAGYGVGTSAFVSLTSMPPDAPVLAAPTHGATGIADSTALAWHSQLHTSGFQLQLSTFPDFSTTLIDADGISDTLLSVSELDLGTLHYWRVSAFNAAGVGGYSPTWTFTTVHPDNVKELTLTPKSFALLPVYPNPFNPTAFITYHLPKTAKVSLVIYNSVGQAIHTLFNGQQQAGRYTMQWDGHDNYGHSVTSGMYLCRFSSGEHVFVQKMLLLR